VSWLDSLARRAARAGGASAADSGAGSGLAGGTTRRAALRAVAGTAGAVALSGSLGFLRTPAADGATSALGECEVSNFSAVYADFQKCIKDPLQAYEAADDVIAYDEDNLLHQKKPSARKRLKRRIKAAKKAREQARKDLEFCDAALVQDRSEGEKKCMAENPSSGGAGGGTGGGGGSNGGCEVGYVPCPDYCCNTGNAYCQSCPEKLVCCRIDADCCPQSG
jgi:hypothetical protein